jgi:WD40 repeat protein
MSLENGFLLHERYRIEKVLGHGGMGAVYLATDESLGIQCAIKENLNLSPESERQFKREATLLATLRHPNLPRVTNHFVLGNQQYLVMDFVEGEDLKERLEAEGPLPEADVLRWGEQIAYALIYLHGLKPPIIHRDIKPANIKITPAGEALLVDFGIAKAGAAGQRTTTGAAGLTPGYAPPEQYGTGQTDARTDEYALAATVYHLLSGLQPPDSVERMLGNKTLTPLEQLRPDLAPHVAAALARAMQINPDNRFQRVADFLDALLGRVPVEAMAAPAAETVSPPAKLETAAAAATQSGAGAAGVAVTLPGEAARPRARRAGRAWVFSLFLVALVIALVGLVVNPSGITDALLAQLFPTLTPVKFATWTPVGIIAQFNATRTPSPTLTSIPPTGTPAPTLTPSPVPTLGPTPAPQLISVENAGSWRLYNQWSPGALGNVLFALGPDGKTVAFTKDQGVDIFDLLTGETVQRLQGFIVTDTPLAVAYLHDSLLVQFSEEILRWDIATNTFVERYQTLPASNLVVSPNETWMAVRAKYITVMNLDNRRSFNVGDENSRQFYQFSPDDRYLAITNGDNVQLISLANQSIERTLFGHGKPTAGLAFTRDGSRLISASGDIWDMTDPGATTPVAVFDSPLDLQYVAVSPDGNVIVGSDGTMWSAADGKKLGALEREPMRANRVAFTPDGMFVIVQAGGDALQLWTIGEPGAASAPTGFAAAPPEREAITPFNLARVQTLRELGGGYQGAVFSQDGRTAAGWTFNSVDILGLADGGTLFSLDVSGAISSTAYVGSDYLLVAYTRGRVERWDLTERRLKQTYEAEGTRMKVSRDGRLFALQGKYIQVVDVLTGKFLHKGIGTADSGQDFEFAPDGKLLAVASRKSVNLFDISGQTAQQVRTLSTHFSDPLSLTFTPDGARLVSASGDIWDLTGRSPQPMATFESTTDVVTISPDGALILGGDGSVWDAATGQFIGQFPGLSLSAVAFTPDNQYIWQQTTSGAIQTAAITAAAQGARVDVSSPDSSRESVAAENATRLGLLGWWGDDDLLAVRLLNDAPSGRFTQFARGQYSSFALHSDGSLLAALGGSGVDLIDVNQGKVVGQFSALLNAETIVEAAFLGDELLINKRFAGVERWDLAQGVMTRRYNVTGESLVASPGGKRFALYSDNNVLALEVESGAVVFSQRAANAQGNFAFSPDGQFLALADGLFVNLWSLETGKREKSNLRGHTQRVLGLAFTPDGKKLISASGDIWDLETGKLAAEFDPEGAARVAVSPDGQIIATSDGGVWETATGSRIATLTEQRGNAARLAFAANGQFLIAQAGSAIYVWGVRPAPPAVELPSDASVVTAANAANLTRQSLWGRGRITSAFWSPDDKYIAVNTTQNVIFYEADTLKPVRVVWDAVALAFDTADYALIGGALQELRLIDLATGETVRAFKQLNGDPQTGVTVAAFSPDEKWLAIGGQIDPAGKPDGLAVIETASGLKADLDTSLGFGGNIVRIEFAADNLTLAVTTFNPTLLKGVISVWDAETRGQVHAAITGVSKPPTLSPDGKFIAFFDGRRIVIQTLRQGGFIQDINEDGVPPMPASTTIDPIRLFNYAYAADGRLLGFYHTLKGNTLTVVRWNIDPASAALTYQETPYRIGLDGYVAVFGEFYTDIRAQRAPYFGLSHSNQRFFSLTADGILRVWDFDGNALAESPTDYLEQMALSPDGKMAAVPNAVGGIEIVALASGQTVATIPGVWYPSAMAYNSASVLAILHGENQITFWDTAKNQKIEEYAGDRFANSNYFTMSSDGSLFAIWVRSASKDYLNVFSLNSAQPLFDFGRYPKAAPMRFSPDGRYLAVVNNNKVDVWDLQTRQKVVLESNSKLVGELVFSADSARLAAATGEIWEIPGGALTAAFDPAKGMTSAALSPNGEVIVGNEGTLWGGTNGQPIGTLTGMRGPALAQWFTPDGKQLVRLTKEGVIEMWAMP